MYTVREKVVLNLSALYFSTLLFEEHVLSFTILVLASDSILNANFYILIVFGLPQCLLTDLEANKDNNNDADDERYDELHGRCAERFSGRGVFLKISGHRGLS